MTVYSVTIRVERKKHPTTFIVSDRVRDGWQDSALCKGMDVFFPSPNERVATEIAMDTCQMCPVRQQCLSYAIFNNEHQGIWGGTSQRTRVKIRRALKKEHPSCAM